MVLVNIPGHLLPLKNCFSQCSAWGLPSALPTPVALARGDTVTQAGPWLP